jgi:hypothetical protein
MAYYDIALPTHVFVRNYAIQQSAASMTSDISAPWRYTFRVPDSRQAYLLSASSFSTIADDLCLHFEAKDADIEKANVGAELCANGCRRPRLKLIARRRNEYTDQILDTFFNSPVGYRAQFYVSPSNGDDASRELFKRLVAGPLAQLCVTGIEDFSGNIVEKALLAPTAKVWIPKPSWPEDEPPREIEAPKWIAAQNGEIPLPPNCRSWAPYWGTAAPIPNFLEIMGAWLDRDNNEFQDPSKLNRSLCLHVAGWV